MNNVKITLICLSFSALGFGYAQGGDPILMPGKAPVIVEDQGPIFRGDWEFNGGYTWLRGDALNTHSYEEGDGFWSAGSVLQLGTMIREQLFLQFDGFGEIVENHGFDATYDHGFGAAVHLMKRRAESGGIGIFAGGLMTDQGTGLDTTSQRYFIGVEAHRYMGRSTLYGHLGFLGGEGGDDDDGIDSIHEAFFGSVGIRHFLNETLMLEAEFAAAFGVMDDFDDDVSVFGWSVRAEKQLFDHLSAAIGYQWAYYHQDGLEDEKLYEQMVYLAFTILFDNGTLLERDRNSTSLDTPPFLRWVAETGGPLE